MKHALPPSKCGKYAPIGRIVAQILSTTQIVWLPQALAMFVVVDTQQISIGSLWKVLGTLYYFDSPSEK
jgi:hypothetical protein